MQLRWGVKGCGLISDDFIHSLEAHPADAHKVVAVCSSNADRARAFIAKNQRSTEAAVYTSIDEFLADKNIDIVYVSSLNPDHHGDVMAALQAGKPVLCEKPMGTSLAQCQQMVALAREKRVFFMEAYWTRFFPAMAKLRAHLAADSIGRVDTVHARFYLGEVDEEKVTRLSKPEQGGSCLMDIGCYLVQFAQYVFREKPTKVHVTPGQRFSTGIDSCATITLTFSGDRLAILSYSAHSAAPNEAVVTGATGYIKLGSWFHCPDEIEVQVTQKDESGRTSGQKKLEDVKLPLPDVSRPFNFQNSVGLSYEAEAVRQAIMQGKTEHPDLTLDDSLQIHGVLQQCWDQLYPPVQRQPRLVPVRDLD